MSLNTIQFIPNSSSDPSNDVHLLRSVIDFDTDAANPMFRTSATFSGSVTIGNVTLAGNTGGAKVDVFSDGTSNAMVIQANKLPLPGSGATLAATSANQTTQNTTLSYISTNTGSIITRIPAVGQTTMAASLPVAIASNQSAISCSQNGTWTVGVTGSPAFATSTKQSDGTQKTQVVDGSGNVIGATSNALDVNVKSSTGTASSNSYYNDQYGTALTSSFVQQLFGFTSIAATVINDDNSNYLEWSWNGSDVAGKLLRGEKLTMDNSGHTSIYLLGQGGNVAYRLIVW